MVIILLLWLLHMSKETEIFFDVTFDYKERNEVQCCLMKQ